MDWIWLDQPPQAGELSKMSQELARIERRGEVGHLGMGWCQNHAMFHPISKNKGIETKKLVQKANQLQHL